MKVWHYRIFVLPKLIKRVSCKDRINVVFLALNTSMWRYDGVYRKLLADSRFNPVILTAMRTNESPEEQIEDQNRMIEFFSAKGYVVLPGFDVKNGEWRDLRNLSPDIVFYTQQYSISLCPQYDCEVVKNYALICFAPYSLPLVTTEHNFNSAMHNYAWLNFMISKYYIGIGRQYSFIGCLNAIVAGYGVGEEIEVAKKSNSSMAAWNMAGAKKRIIWAPHHTIGECGQFQIGAFLEICDEMLELRDAYRDSVVFAFKPHPMMLTKLYRVWNKERADDYYRKWATGANSFLADGMYIDLFAGSDAMIHDSSSFVAEYIYTGKPVAYTFRKEWRSNDYNQMGIDALKVHYSLKNASEIKEFIDEVVLSGRDVLRNERDSFAAKYLNDRAWPFSENVVNAIRKGLEYNG